MARCALANDCDGFTGIIPKSSATVAEVLKDYGYNTGAWGKWHNTPSEQITTAGPFHYWPTAYGFEYFYGFLAGEASQYEQMVRNPSRCVRRVTSRRVIISPRTSPRTPSSGCANSGPSRRTSRSSCIGAPGASHGPHQVMKLWADKYNNKFDDGWDAYRERVFTRAKEKGWIPQNAQLTPHPATMASWESIPEDERPFPAPPHGSLRRRSPSTPTTTRDGSR